MKKTIAIIGGGNGAHTMAADLAMRGYRIRMYEDSAFIGKLSVLRDTLTIRCTGLLTGEGHIEFLTDDMAKAIETGRPGRTTSKQTFHVLEAMAGIMKSAETGEPYVLTSHFDREAPMDPTLEHGVL